MKNYRTKTPEEVTRALLVRGGAFWSDRYRPKRRIYVIGNVNPTTDNKLILFASTTQEEGCRKHHGDLSNLVLVVLERPDYPPAYKRCVLDCESYITVARSDFEQDARDYRHSPMGQVPEPLMVKIVEAVRNCRQMNMIEKRLVLGPDPVD